MNRTSRKIIVGILFLFILLLAFTSGPRFIGSLYYALTPKAKIEAKKIEYNQLANAEPRLTGIALSENFKKRYLIYNWLFARGIDIDGGDSETILYAWESLIAYWTNDDGSKYLK